MPVKRKRSYSAAIETVAVNMQLFSRDIGYLLSPPTAVIRFCGNFGGRIFVSPPAKFNVVPVFIDGIVCVPFVTACGEQQYDEH